MEVKGWGAPFIAKRGGFSWPQDLQTSQYKAACDGRPLRVEIVANLTAYLAGKGPYERLTVTADFIAEHAVPAKYEVDLEPLRDQIKVPFPQPAATPAT